MVVLPRLAGPDSGGDAVVFHHVLEQLGRRMTLVRVEFDVTGWPERLFNLLTLSCPPELARHIGRKNRALVEHAVSDLRPEVICFLHEAGFAFLEVAKRRNVPAVLYPHNVHSVVARTDDSMLGRVFAPAARAFERRWYGDPYAALVCISETDARALRSAGIRGGKIPIAPPGASGSAAVLDQLVLTGSYGWWRKRRHLARFAREAGVLDGRILVTDRMAKEILGDTARLVDRSEIDWAAGLRFGLITDAFAGGFKLKALEYVALNCLVLSYCDLSPDFEGLPHSAEFIRKVSSKADIAKAMRDVAAAAPGELAGRFRVFKQACLARFDWKRCIEPLEHAILSRADSTALLKSVE